MYGDDREQAKSALQNMLQNSRICGPPTNLDFLLAVALSPEFQRGLTLTNFLDSFKYEPKAMEIISGGSYTLVQDLGRPKVGHGVPRAGAMDPLSLKIANLLVGNEEHKEALEVTIDGPKILFHAPAVIAITGATIDALIDGKEVPMNTRLWIDKGQMLKLGKITGNGCRAYLGVHGGFPNIASYFGSKSTSPLVNIGGYQGRQLAPGDLLSIDIPHDDNLRSRVSIPQEYMPEFCSHWILDVMAGPYAEGYLLPEDEKMIFETHWKISHNASRAGIRLVGPAPQWARPDGMALAREP